MLLSRSRLGSTAFSMEMRRQPYWGWEWEASGDRAGFSDPVDGAARSETWLLHQRTSVSGRLNGYLNTQRCVNKGQLTPGGQEGANIHSKLSHAVRATSPTSLQIFVSL